jgi:hypothetical protein
MVLPAQRPYEQAGFRDGPPFAGDGPDPISVFTTLGPGA